MVPAASSPHLNPSAQGHTGVGAVVLLTALASGCAGGPAPSSPPLTPLTGVTAQQLADLPQPPPVESIMSLSEPMQGFVDRLADESNAPSVRVDQLSQAIMNPGQLALSYDSTVTATAAETFFLQRGNCLSLSLMSAALARALGLDVTFRRIPGEPEWDTRTGLLIAAGHINVSGRTGSRQFVLDFYPQADTESTEGIAMRDREVFAHYYNNLGAEFLAANDLPAAWLHFRTALDTWPTLAAAWSNLGVAYRRAGQSGDAERALRHALALAPALESAQMNLALVLDDRGQRAIARALRADVRARRERNPFYHLAQADRALQNGDAGTANARLRSGLALSPDSQLFFAHAVRIATTTGNAALLTRLQDAAARFGSRPF